MCIDGHTVHFAGGFCDGQANKVDVFTESYVDAFSAGLKALNYQLIYFDAPYGLASTFTASDAGRGVFLICAAVADECTADTPILAGSFSPETIRVTTGGTGVGVPEPASWSLMIAGFSLAGAALRRRRKCGHNSPLAHG